MTKRKLYVVVPFTKLTALGKGRKRKEKIDKVRVNLYSAVAETHFVYKKYRDYIAS